MSNDRLYIHKPISIHKLNKSQLEDRLNTLLVRLGEKPAAVINNKNISIELPSHWAQVDGNYLIGRRPEELKLLRAAWLKKDHVAVGLALGYPKECVEAYADTSLLNYANWVSLPLVKSVIAGHQVPSWLGYISHVPKSLDIANGAVCDASRLQGEKYRRAIKSSFPELVTTFDERALHYIPKGYAVDESGEVHFKW